MSRDAKSSNSGAGLQLFYTDQCEWICEVSEQLLDKLMASPQEVQRAEQATEFDTIPAAELLSDNERKARNRRNQITALVMARKVADLTKKGLPTSNLEDVAFAVSMALHMVTVAAGKMLGVALREIDGAMQDATKQVAKHMNDVKHKRHREASALLPELWAQHEKAGLKKGPASKLIAKELSLSPATVRRRLQGL